MQIGWVCCPFSNTFRDCFRPSRIWFHIFYSNSWSFIQLGLCLCCSPCLPPRPPIFLTLVNSCPPIKVQDNIPSPRKPSLQVDPCFPSPISPPGSALAPWVSECMCLVLSSPDWEIFRYGAGTEASHSPQNHSAQGWAVGSGSCLVNQRTKLLAVYLRFCIIRFGKLLFILQNPPHITPPPRSLSQVAFTKKTDLETGPPVSQWGHARLIKTSSTVLAPS